MYIFLSVLAGLAVQYIILFLSNGKIQGSAGIIVTMGLLASYFSKKIDKINEKTNEEKQED